MNRLRVLLVDDEQPALDRMAALLQVHASVEVVGSAKSVAEATAGIDSLKPDAVFLDVKMGDGDAFDVLKAIQHLPSIVFATAYSDYAHRAFEHRVVDYLVKPVEASRLSETISRLQSLPAHSTNQQLDQLLELAASLRQQRQPVSHPVTIGDRTFFVRYDDITHFEAREKLVYLCTKEKKEYPIDTSLSRLAESLPPQFVQVHRAFVINCDYLSEMHRYFGGKYKLLLGRPMIVTVESGSTYKDVVEKLRVV